MSQHSAPSNGSGSGSGSGAHDFLQCALPRHQPGDVRSDTTWTEGDFELVSSDGVRFRVPSYHMYASS